VSADRQGRPIRALGLSCTLKRSPTRSSTEALTEVVLEALREEGAVARAFQAKPLGPPPG